MQVTGKTYNNGGENKLKATGSSITELLNKNLGFNRFIRTTLRNNKTQHIITFIKFLQNQLSKSYQLDDTTEFIENTLSNKVKFTKKRKWYIYTYWI